ncbi:MAG: histidine phosphatase family protein [Acidobacteria bacterium]|jgi:probable phosphoglycerate mutase|nr:histidine phosphatase family protein [Acidobacteriota bacterium]
MTENQKPVIQSPNLLWLVRHGESTANVARQKAEAEGLLTIDFPEREADVPLSPFGIEQSVKLGKYFLKEKEKPSVIFCSPFLRTTETARLIAENAGLKNVRIYHDERIRERELGIFDRLTSRGVMRKYPEEYAKRKHLGKFYYRPAGGESWADVAFRIRSFWRDLREEFSGEDVLITTHEAVIHVFRYVLERMTEAQILEIDGVCDIANCAVTTYRLNGDKFDLQNESLFG